MASPIFDLEFDTLDDDLETGKEFEGASSLEHVEPPTKIARFASRSLGDVNRLIGERVPASTKRTTDHWLNVSYLLRPGETHRESARRSRKEDCRSSRPLLREQPRTKRAAVPKTKPYGPSSCSSPPHLVYETRYKHRERRRIPLGQRCSGRTTQRVEADRRGQTSQA